MSKFKKIDTSIEGVYVIEPTVFGDNRGYFMETYSKEEFKEIGLNYDFIQDNQSKSKKGVLRGLHFQKENTQAKLVRCIKGEVFDVAVDLRPGSKTYGKWEGVVLTEENKKMLLENIQNGKAYSKFIELVQNQGGDIEYVKDVTKFEKAKIIQEVISTTEGYVQEINAEEIGKLSCELGAGRKTKKDKIDLQVGIILNKKIGDFVNKGDKLATIYANDREKAKDTENELLRIYKIGQEKIEENTIIDIIE